MPVGGQMVSDPSQLAGMFPLGNPSGGSNPLGPLGINLGSGSLGGASSPFTPAPVSSGNMPSLTQPGATPGGGGFGAYSSPYGASGTTAGVAGLTPGTPETSGGLGDIATSLQHTYYGGAGTALAQFLQGGAGFNPQVAQALIAALQPQIASGRANLMEQYGATGTAASSAGQLGLAAYDAQTNLAVGQLLSGLYEQSVQNYMNVLMGTEGHGVNFGQQMAQTIVGGLLGSGSVGGTTSGGTAWSI